MDVVWGNTCIEYEDSKKFIRLELTALGISGRIY